MEKAWEDISFSEALSEGIVGLMLGLFALWKGWIDQHGAFEMIMDAVGFALLFPIVHFIIRVIFVAPSQIIKEMTEAKKNSHPEINPKTIYPSIIAVLGSVCALLLIFLGLSIKLNFQKLKDSHGEARIHPQPIPEKTIPTSEFQPAKIIAQVATNAPTKQAESVNPIDKLETFSSDTNADAFSAEKYFAEKKAAEEKKLKDQSEAEQGWWDGEKPFYKQAIVLLRDRLKKLADKSGDGIAESTNYFDCLPANVPTENETTLALIRFQNDTNMSFLIKAKQNGYRRNVLLISASGASLIVHADSQAVGVNLVVPTEKIDDDRVVPLEQGKAMIDEKIPYFISWQEYFLKTQNKRDTKTLDGR